MNIFAQVLTRTWDSISWGGWGNDIWHDWIGKIHFPSPLSDPPSHTKTKQNTQFSLVSVCIPLIIPNVYVWSTFGKSDCNYKCQIQIFTYVKTFFPLDDLTHLKLTLESSKKKYNCVYPWIRIQKLIIIIQVLFYLCKMVCFHLVIRGYCYQPLNISLSHLQNNL